MMKNRKQIQGVLLLVGAALLYSLSSVFSRLIGQEFQVFSQSTIRSILILIMYIVYSLVSSGKEWRKIEKRDIKWFLTRSLAGVAVMLFAFLAFQNLSIGIVYFFMYSASTTFGFLLGRVLFGEKLNVSKILSLVAIVVGILLVYSIDIDVSSYPYIIAAILTGALVSYINISSKKLSGRYSVVQVGAMLSLTSVVLGLVGMFINAEVLPPFSSFSWMWISIFAVTDLLGTILMMLGYKKLEAQIASSIMPMEIVFGVIWGILVFQENLPFMALVGGLLIFSATILSAFGSNKSKS